MLFEYWKSYGPIKCAAWQWKNADEPTNTEPHIATGISHAKCLKQMIKDGAQPTARRNLDFELQGFMTSDEHFVDREIAYLIAVKYNQLKSEEKTIMAGRNCPKLYSEFCNFQ